MPDLNAEVARILALESLAAIDAIYKKSVSPAADELMLLLLASGHVLHSQKAANWLAANRTIGLLKQIRKIRNDLPAHTGLRDYRWTVDRTIAILENYKKGAECHCNLYETHGAFDEKFTPDWEARDRFISIDSENVHSDEYFTEWYATCKTCRRQWKIRDDISYHYPLYAWEEIKSRAKSGP